MLPKKITHKVANSQQKIITNYTLDDASLTVEKVISFIDMSIDLHILNVLWVIKTGYKLSSNAPNSYGNVLFGKRILNNVEDDRLFKIYWYKYRDWRNNAIVAMKELRDNSKNSMMIMLDIKEFYNSVRIPIKDLTDAIGKSDNVLTEIIIKISQEYFNKCELELKLELKLKSKEQTKFFLPIGLASSPVIANWYLKKLDNNIITNSRPYYYGRYIDDIICVYHYNELPSQLSTEELIKSQFNGIIKIKKNNENNENNEYNIQKIPELNIQKEKVISIVLNKDMPFSILEKFKHEIDKQTSEFRFLPDINNVENLFNVTTGRINYKDSIHKLQSIVEFNNDKFSLSSFLSKIIYIKIKFGKSFDKIDKDLLMFFSDKKNVLEYFQFWSKIFIYFISNNNLTNLFNVLSNINNAINSLKDNNKDIVKFLHEYKKNALIYGWSYKVNSSNDDNSDDDNSGDSISDEDIDIFEDSSIKLLNNKARMIRMSKLFNKKYYPISILYDMEKQNKYFKLTNLKLSEIKWIE